MKRGKKLLLGTTAFLLLLSGAFTWLVTTESGARWAFARAEPMLPQPLTLGTISGSLAGELRIDTVTWRDASANVSVERVLVDARILPLLSRRVYIDRLEVGAATVELLPAADGASSESGLPEVRLPIDLWLLDSSFSSVTIESDGSEFVIETAALAARMRDADLEVDLLQVESETLSLTVDGDLRLAGDYRAAANVSWRWRDDTEFAGRLRIFGDLDRYDIQHALHAPVSVTSRGAASVDDDGSIFFGVDHEWQNVEWNPGERRLSSADGVLVTMGTLESIDVTLDTSLQLDALPESRIRLAANVDSTGMRIDNGSLQNEIGLLDVSGNVAWTPELALDFRLTGLDPASVSERMTGEVGVAGRLDASLLEGGIQGSLRVDEVIGNINGSDLSGSAEVDWAQDVLTVTAAQLAVGDNRIGAEGSLGEAIAVSVDFAFDDLQDAFGEAAGSLEGRLSISGSRDAPELSLSSAGADIRYGRYGLESISIDSALRSEGLCIVDIRANGISIGKETIDEVRASVSGDPEQQRLNLFAATGAAELSVGAAGGIGSNGRWRGEIATVDVDSETFGNWSSAAAAPVEISPNTLDIGTICVVSESTDGRACGGMIISDGVNYGLEVEIDSLPVGALPLGLPETTAINGFLDARVVLGLYGDVIEGSGNANLREASLSSLVEGEELTVSLADAGARFTIEDNRGWTSVRLELDDSGGEATFEMLSEDVLDITAPIEGDATVSLADTDLFAFLLPALSDPYGVIEGSLEIGGTPSEPEFDGALTLSDGRFAVREAGIAVFDVNGRVEQHSTGRLRLSGSGRSGDGSVSIEGETFVGAETGIRSEVSIQGENFELIRLPDWQLTASPDAKIVFDDRNAVVTGSLEIPRAAITLRSIPATAVSASPDVVVHRPEGDEVSRGRRIDIDVDVSLGEDVAFSGFGLETGLEGALRLRGGSDEPYTGVGRLTLVEGRYEAYGQELEIELGNLTFNGPLDEPQLDVRAVRRTTDVTAGILLTGTPSQLRSELVSEPSVSDAEALSYLLTGRSLENASSAGDGDTLNQAAFTLGLSGAGSIVSQIRSDLGLDTLSVEGGSSGSRIVAGKQINDRLFVEYGYGLIDQLGELLLRYQLNDRLILESRTGSVSNLDLVYSVRKK